MADAPPQLRPPHVLGLELERTVQVLDSFIDFVTTEGELGSASQPADRLQAQTLELVLRSGPGQVGVLGATRLRVMVGQ